MKLFSSVLLCFHQALDGHQCLQMFLSCIPVMYIVSLDRKQVKNFKNLLTSISNSELLIQISGQLLLNKPISCLRQDINKTKWCSSFGQIVWLYMFCSLKNRYNPWFQSLFGIEGVAAEMTKSWLTRGRCLSIIDHRQHLCRHFRLPFRTVFFISPSLDLSNLYEP